MHKKCVVLFQLLSLIICASMTEYNEQSNVNIITKYSDDNDNENEEMLKCDWKEIKYCSLYCNDLNEVNLGIIIEKLIKQNRQCKNDGVNLILKSIKFINSTLTKDKWNTLNNMQINSMTLNALNINNIKDDAFNCIAFKGIKSLTLMVSNVDDLTNKSLNGLSSLEHLNISGTLIQGKFTTNILAAVRATLKTIQFRFDTNGNSLSLENITGSREMQLSNVEMIDLRYNNLKSSLNKHTFIGVARVKQLYLSNCNIYQIGLNTFDVVSETIEVIDLQHNHLKQLPNEMFNIILTHRIDLQIVIYLNDNNWQCDCTITSLKWLQQNFPLIFQNQIYCYDSKTLSTRLIAAQDFCNETNHQTTKSMIDDHQYDEYRRSLYAQSITQQCTSQTNPSQIDEITIQNNDIKMDITQTKGDVKIDFDENPNNDFILLWFSGSPSLPTYISSDNENDVNCVHNIEQSIKLKNLTLDKTYTFCLMGKSETTVSPLNCVPFYLKTIGEAETVWLSQDAKALTISLIVLGVLFSSVLGLIIGICVVRRNPTWLRGSKRVVVVNSRSNSKASDVMVMPPEWSKDDNLNDSNNNNNNNNNQLPYRRHSDASIASGKSYVTAVNPSQFDLIKYQIDKAKKLESQNNYYLENLPDLNPPPLPPPNRRSQSSTTSTVQLCSVSGAVDENYYASYCYK